MSCQCKTKSGKKCSRKAEEKSKYCWQHQSKTPAKSGPSVPRPKSPILSKNIKSPKKLTSVEREHQARYCKCIMDVKAKSPKYNPWAVCSKTVGRVTNSCKEFE